MSCLQNMGSEIKREEMDPKSSIKIEENELMNEICRACHQKSNNFYFLSENISLQDQTSLANLLSLCAAVEVQENDEFSQIICAICQEKLRQWYDFRRTVQEANNIFKTNKLFPKEDFKKSELFEKVEIKMQLPNASEDINEDFCSDLYPYCDITQPSSDQSLIDSFNPEEVESNERLKDRLNCSMPDCNMSFKSQFRLENHLFVQHKTCQYCLTQFSSKSELLAHLKEHSDMLRFACELCGKRYHNKGPFLRHVRYHSKLPCETCGKLFSDPPNLKVHQRIHKKIKPFKCELCGKQFTRAITLKYHMGVHTTERNFPCDICSKTFKTDRSLISHKELHSDKSVVCPVCNKKFKNSKVLGMHKNVHSDEKAKVCEICGKKFAQTYEYDSHKMTHTGERRYFCKLCPKGFILLHRLKKHERDDHKT